MGHATVIFQISNDLLSGLDDIKGMIYIAISIMIYIWI